MQTKLAILAIAGAIGTTYASPAGSDVIPHVKLTYFKDHHCKSKGPQEVTFYKPHDCYNLANGARSFQVHNLPKGCNIAAYKGADCPAIDFEILSSADNLRCVLSDGKRTGDVIHSMSLNCRK